MATNITGIRTTEPVDTRTKTQHPMYRKHFYSRHLLPETRFR